MNLIEPYITADENHGVAFCCTCGYDIWVNADETKVCPKCGKRYFMTYLIFECQDNELCFYDRVKECLTEVL